MYPSQHFPFGAVFVCQAGNFWTLLRTPIQNLKVKINEMLWEHLLQSGMSKTKCNIVVLTVYILNIIVSYFVWSHKLYVVGRLNDPTGKIDFGRTHNTLVSQNSFKL